MDATRTRRLLSLGLLVGAVAVLVLSTRSLHWTRIEPMVAPVFAGAFLIGALAAWLRRRGHARLPAALTVACAIAAVGYAVLRHTEYPPTNGLGILLLAVFELPLLVAVAACTARPRGLGFGVGAAVIAASSWYVDSGPALLVLGYLVGLSLIAPRPDADARLNTSLLGAGALAVLLGSGIAFDVVAALRASFVEPSSMSRAYVDGPLTYVPRLVLEGSLLAACLAVARGRTWGLMAVLLASPLLVVLLRFDLPAVGGGCISWGHPLENDWLWPNWPLFVAVALLVVPWVRPLLRTIRAGSRSR